MWTRTGRSFFDQCRPRAAARPASDGCRAGRAVRRARDRPGCCSTPSSCRGAPRPRSCSGTSTPRSVRPPERRCRWRSSLLDQERGRARVTGLDVAGLDLCSAERPGRGTPTPTRSPTPTGATAGRPTGWTGCSWRRSSVLAAEGATFHDRPHDWHLALADRLVAADPALIAPTRPLFVDTTDVGVDRRGHAVVGASSPPAAARAWWSSRSPNLVRAGEGLVQPGLKVRGREYLRIIYGPDYTEPATSCGCGSAGLGHKRSLAAARVRARAGGARPGRAW